MVFSYSNREWADTFLFPCMSIKDEVQIVCTYIRDSVFFLIANMNINLALFYVGLVLCRTELFSILYVVAIPLVCVVESICPFRLLLQK